MHVQPFEARLPVLLSKVSNYKIIADRAGCGLIVEQLVRSKFATRQVLHEKSIEVHPYRHKRYIVLEYWNI